MTKTKRWSLVAALLVIFGCGGSSDEFFGGNNDNPFNALYRVIYSEGYFLMDVHKDGTVDTAINDNQVGFLGGNTGTVSETGVLNGVTVGAGPTVGVTGTLTGSGNNRQGLVTLGTPINENNLQLTLMPDQNPFLDSYTGTIAGDVTGTFSTSVNSDGAIAPQVVVGGNTYTGTGQINRVGIGTFTAGGTGQTYTITFNSGFRLGDNDVKTVSGTWSGTGPNGAISGTFQGTSN